MDFFLKINIFCNAVLSRKGTKTISMFILSVALNHIFLEIMHAMEHPKKDILKNEKKDRSKSLKKEEKEKHKSIDKIWERLSFEQKIKTLASIGYQDEDGITPLILAIKFGCDQLSCDLITKKGVDINRADNKGRTPLMHAISCGNVDIVRLLLTHEDIEENKQDEYENTALHYAALKKQGKILRILILNPRIRATIQNNMGNAFYVMVANNQAFEENLRQACFARTMIDTRIENIIEGDLFVQPVQIREKDEQYLNLVVDKVIDTTTDYRHGTSEHQPLPDCFSYDLIKEIVKAYIDARGSLINYKSLIINTEGS